jgi:hypothetical protein
MDISVDALWQMRQTQLLATYHEARRLYAEKKFARDTERGRLHWLRARAFVNGKGSITERTNAVDASDDLARKGQHVREITHELDLLKSDIDVIAATLRLRGMTSELTPKPDEAIADETNVSDEID